MPESPAVVLTLKPSRRYAVGIIAGYACGGAALGWLSGLLGVRNEALALTAVLLVLGLAAVGVTVARRAALLVGDRAPRRIHLADQVGSVEFSDGRIEHLAPPGQHAVAADWVALAFSTGSGGALWLPRLMLPEQAHRRLRLWSLWGRASSD